MLLILAGVALATLTGQGNIIGNAENAVGKYNNSVSSEQQLLNEIEKYFQNYLEGGNGAIPPEAIDIPEVDENGLATENTTITTEEENVQIVIPKGFAPVILNGSNSTYSLPGQDGSVKEIMPADQWYNITAEQINQGIVIVDNAITYDNGQITGTVPDFNEYVWVPIPDDTIFKRISWDGSYFTDSWNIGEHPLAEFIDTNKVGKFWEETNSQLYTNMSSSVKNFKGFYIGRYEASNNGDVAQSKRNQKVWNNVTQTQAINACLNNSTTNVHLIYGIEWDSILNWIIGKAKILLSTGTRVMTIEDVENDSTEWGNYYYSEGDVGVNKGPARNTGTSEYWKANNIYDLAGNVWEWTQEKYSTGGKISYRGGHYDEKAGNSPADSRNSSEASLSHSGLRIPHKFFYNC